MAETSQLQCYFGGLGRGWLVGMEKKETAQYFRSISPTVMAL